MGPSFTADGMSSVRSRMSFMTGSAGGRGRNSGGDRHKGQVRCGWQDMACRSRAHSAQLV
jgi:hypothetical protein